MVNHESLVDLKSNSQIDQVLVFAHLDAGPVTQRLRETTCSKTHIADLQYFPVQLSASAALNKTQLIEHIAATTDLSKAAAGRVLSTVLDSVTKTLKKGGTVSLTGFGSFSVTKRKARIGRNPQTGDALKIKAAKVPQFRPSQGLKDALN
jgi:DNA-binding protein HU-beta